MEAFAGRARRELAATGERVRRRSVDAGDELTAQEAAIAPLGVVGNSNRESSRQELATALDVDRTDGSA